MNTDASNTAIKQHAFKSILSEPKQCAFIDGNSVCSAPPSDAIHIRPTPQVGDEWEFRLPHMKAKRKKIVGSIGTKEFIVERGTYPKWEDKTERLPYVHWKRENKGRYTGITVRRLMEFGYRLSTLAEREARYAAIAEQRKREREERIAHVMNTTTDAGTPRVCAGGADGSPSCGHATWQQEGQCQHATQANVSGNTVCGHVCTFSEPAKLPIGTRVRFPRDVDSPANEEHPHLIYARAGEQGEIVGHNEWAHEGYMIKADKWPDPFGASRQEFEPVEPAKRLCASCGEVFYHRMDCRYHNRTGFTSVLDSERGPELVPTMTVDSYDPQRVWNEATPQKDEAITQPKFDGRSVDPRTVPEKWLSDVKFFDHVHGSSSICTWQCGVCFQIWDSSAKLPCPRCRQNWQDELAALSLEKRQIADEIAQTTRDPCP